MTSERDPLAAPEAADADGPAGTEKPAGKIATARAGVSKAQARAQLAYKRLEASRQTNHMVDAGFHFYERDLGAGGGVLAGALAFRLFLFAVPYVFVVLTIFGSTADLQNESGQEAARSAGLTGLIGKAVADAQHQTNSTKILSIFVGTFALVLGARAVVKTLRAVHALAWRVPLTRLRHSTRAAGLLIAIILGASLVTTGISKVRSERPLIGFVVGLFSVVVWGGSWLWISWLLPHARGIPWTALVPGALLFGLVIWSMHLLTVFYFAGKVSHASDTYGAIGSAIGILLALYLIGRAMSASATLNATLWERKQMQAAGDTR
ncbi:MAG: YhjD/YihY/BrkB family envelope integrity protein [Acidimicrobiia bacterium]